jgi:glycosyltransferase involved in cell wall biosynthesis
LNIEGKPYSIIYNGCNVPEQIITPPEAIPGKPFLFSIGQFHSRKNFHVLPALLVGNEYELIIAGRFSVHCSGDRAGKELNVIDRLKLIGAISEQEKFRITRTVSPLFLGIGEGFGLPVLEDVL